MYSSDPGARSPLADGAQVVPGDSLSTGGVPEPAVHVSPRLSYRCSTVNLGKQTSITFILRPPKAKSAASEDKQTSSQPTDPCAADASIPQTRQDTTTQLAGITGESSPNRGKSSPATTAEDLTSESEERAEHPLFSTPEDGTSHASQHIQPATELPGVTRRELPITGSFPATSRELPTKCKHNAFHVTSDVNSMWKNPDVVRSATKSDIELAKALGVSVQSLDPAKVTERKLSIHQKLNCVLPNFTLEEEFDIHCRAESHACSVPADPDHLLPEVGGSLGFGASAGFGGLAAVETLTPWSRPHRPRGRKRRRLLCDPAQVDPYDTYCVCTADGTRLLKPSCKLVELVARAINDSPDCMLQVQQIYTVLQNKYPYFRHFDKSSLTSWKSSIRHALYQKWFSKIDGFLTDFISVRGCYWTISREQTPKDWRLPRSRYLRLQDECCDSQNDCDWLEEELVSDQEQSEISEDKLTASLLPDHSCDRDWSDDNQSVLVSLAGRADTLNSDPDPILNDLNTPSQSSDSSEHEILGIWDPDHPESQFQRMDGEDLMSYGYLAPETSDPGCSGGCPQTPGLGEVLVTDSHFTMASTLVSDSRCGLEPVCDLDRDPCLLEGALSMDDQSLQLGLYEPFPGTDLPFYLGLPAIDTTQIFSDG